MQVKFKKLHPDAIVPVYEKVGDAGLSLRSIEEKCIYPNEVDMVKTGISIELPPGYEAQIRPRSGLALKHGVVVVNSPGTIDSNYRGEICVLLSTLMDESYTIDKGDAIAQMVIAKHETVEFVEAEDLSETNRGADGFGSTGK